jgi:hypothetical protein
MKGNARNKVLKVPPICPGIEVTKYQEEICEDYLRELQSVFDYEPLNFLIGYDVPNQFRPKRRTAAEKKKYERMTEYPDRIFMDED